MTENVARLEAVEQLDLIVDMILEYESLVRHPWSGQNDADMRLAFEN